MLQHITISNFVTAFGQTVDIPLSYEVFGRELHTAPIILVNHALTGNSTVCGEKGWWKTLIGDGKVVDTQKYTVICFNVPGNGYDNFFIENPENFTAKDMASIFIKGLEALQIHQLYALIGGSVGGSIGWEMLVQKPNLAQKFIPTATDYKTTDWLYSQCLVQKFLLESDENPLEKARTHAMLCYRTPESLNSRFRREKMEGTQKLKSQDWLDYHGRALAGRFSLQSYKLMNQLLMTINLSEEDLLNIQAEIHLVSVDTDWFYPASEIRQTFDYLIKNNKKTTYHEIKSIHGHDAF
ncbi:MAG: alpha/beta fold hydrolase, partial [Cruoricaptor ignavus]|nr:alpha/beta fold hydrolase [Cruoricaptor ignavus]